jgi:hypothetical protein
MPNAAAQAPPIQPARTTAAAREIVILSDAAKSESPASALLAGVEKREPKDRHKCINPEAAKTQQSSFQEKMSS